MTIDEIAEKHQVVVMCGVSGSGKTVFAKRLVGKGFQRLSSDAIIWEKYGDTFPELDSDTRKKAFMWAANEIDSSIVVMIKRGERI
ncbi:MAG: ATP-binding protein, partial [Paramuribaculum sp.]|nr:ATP-binding protein [Paramuribaculum sp.]